jgi:hypothetical protein
MWPGPDAHSVSPELGFDPFLGTGRPEVRRGAGRGSPGGVKRVTGCLHRVHIQCNPFRFAEDAKDFGMLRAMARRRSSPDPLATVEELRWLVVRGRCRRALRWVELPPKANLRAALEAERARLRVACLSIAAIRIGTIGSVCKSLMPCSESCVRTAVS